MVVFNKFLVSTTTNNRVLMMNPPLGPISEEDALLLAAWLVALSGGMEKFQPVLDAVERT